MNKIKLLYLISRLDIGGMERQLLTLVSNLDKDRFEIDVVYFQGEGYLKNRFEALGCRVKKLNIWGVWDISIYLRLYIYIKKNNYTLIHTHSLKADLWGAIVGKLAGVPLIISTLHNQERYLKNPIMKILEKWLISQVDDTVIVVSDGVKKFLIKTIGIPEKKIKKVYYGIDASDVRIDKDKDIREEFGLDKDAPLIGSIGRLVPQKGHKYLIQAAVKVSKYFPKAKFFIVGKGTLEKKLKNLAKRLKLDSNIIFTGFREDIYSIIDKLDLLVIPSLWEGFGLVLLEAMAMGKAIVATNVGGIPEVVKDTETGLLVPPKEPDALAEAIICLLEDHSLAKRMGKMGNLRLKENFQPSRMAEGIGKIYQEEICIKNIGD